VKSMCHIKITKYLTFCCLLQFIKYNRYIILYEFNKLIYPYIIPIVKRWCRFENNNKRRCNRWSDLYTCKYNLSNSFLAFSKATGLRGVEGSWSLKLSFSGASPLIPVHLSGRFHGYGTFRQSNNLGTKRQQNPD
jgi:hypothetical protein